MKDQEPRSPLQDKEELAEIIGDALSEGLGLIGVSFTGKIQSVNANIEEDMRRFERLEEKRNIAAFQRSTDAVSGEYDIYGV